VFRVGVVDCSALRELGWLAPRRCAPVTHIDVNQNVGEFQLSDADPLHYFSFDLPAFASQLFFRVNKSGTRGSGTLTSNVRSPRLLSWAKVTKTKVGLGLRIHES
jgi:hypothetical protein